MYDDFYIARAAEDLCELASASRQHHAAHGSWPTLAALREADPSLPGRDRWDGQIRFERIGEDLILSCAGPDRRIGTQDDVVVPPIQPDR